MNGSAKLVGGDTMNYWIRDHRANLEKTLTGVDVLLINDTEAKMLAGINSVPRAAHKVLEMGPEALVIKHGEYGATVFFKQGAYGGGRHPFRAPALPLEEVCDPTGAGDSFDAGFLASWLGGEPLERSLAVGNACGALSTRAAGGVDGQPTMDEVAAGVT